MSKVRAEQYTNRLGTGAPEIPYGVTVPEGASIDGAGGLNLTGIATAGTFKGNLTGDVSGNVTGLAATFSGPVTIGGTLTYEDVTNIDAVGVITARDGLKVTGGNLNVGTAITAYGSTGIVSATSYRGDGSQLSGIEAAPTIQLVADGTIAAHTAVRVTPSGKAATITEFASALGAEQEMSTDVNQGIYSKAAYGYDKITSRVFCVYQKASNNQSAYMVGTRSGNSITWGSEANFGLSGTAAYSNAISIGSDKFFVVFEDGTDIKAVIATTTSSNTATLGTIVTLKGSIGDLHDNPGIHLNPSTGNVILAYAVGGGNGGAFGQMCTISGTTITVGAAVQIGTTGYDYSMGCDSVWDSIRQNVFFVFAGGHTNDKIYGRTVREPSSGTTVLLGTLQQEVNDTVNITSHSVALAFDPIKDSFVCTFRASNTYGYYNYTDTSYDTVNHKPMFKNNGNFELQVGGAMANSQNGLFYDAHYAPSIAKLIITNQNSSNFNGYYSTATFNTNAALTFNSDYTEFQSSDYKYPSRNILLDNGALLLPYIDAGNDDQKTRIKQFQASNVTTGNFIGFSKEAYTNGQTATINVVGNVTTQSGLTPGEQYYVQNDGSVGTSAANPSVEAGKALTATSLLIKG